MQQNNICPALIDWWHASDFEICFEKTLVAFCFDEKHMQSIAQMSM